MPVLHLKVVEEVQLLKDFPNAPNESLVLLWATIKDNLRFHPPKRMFFYSTDVILKLREFLLDYPRYNDLCKKIVRTIIGFRKAVASRSQPNLVIVGVTEERPNHKKKYPVFWEHLKDKNGNCDIDLIVREARKRTITVKSIRPGSPRFHPQYCFLCKQLMTPLVDKNGYVEWFQCTNPDCREPNNKQRRRD
jgi:hypothetical protein